jgi:hypothetical protein
MPPVMARAATLSCVAVLTAIVSALLTSPH